MLARDAKGAFQRQPDPEPRPCITCGSPTSREVVCQLDAKVRDPQKRATVAPGEHMSPGSINYTLNPSTWTLIPFCLHCADRRALWQAERVLSLPQVLEHVRESCKAYAESLRASGILPLAESE